MRINFFRRNPIEGLMFAGSDGSDDEAKILGSDSNKIVWVDLKDRQLPGDTSLLGGAEGAGGGALGGATSDLGNSLGGVTSDLDASPTLGLGLDATTAAPSAADSTSQILTSADPVTATSVPATTEVSTAPETTDASTAQATTDVLTAQATTDASTAQATTDASTAQATTDASTAQATTDVSTPPATTDLSTPPATTEVSTPPATSTSTPPIVVPPPVTVPTASPVTSALQAPAPVRTTTPAPQVISTSDTASTKASTTAITSTGTETQGVSKIPISSADPSSTDAIASTSGLTSDPSTSLIGDRTTFLTSASPIQAADLSPTDSSPTDSSHTDTSSTTKASTGAGVGNSPNNPNASGTISETVSRQSGMSTTTTAIIVVSVIIGITLFGAGFHFFRRFLRARRIARAESPPSSPLLRAADEKSLFPPMSAHSRSPSAQSNYSANHSEFWPTTRGSTVLGPRAEQVLGRMDSFRKDPQNPPLSPLPPAAMGNPPGYRLYPPQAPGDLTVPVQPRAY